MLNYDEAGNEWIERIGAAIRFLPDKPEETAESTLRALWLKAAGTPVSAARAMDMAMPVLSAEQAAVLEELVGRRIDGVPLAHITERQQFMGVELLAGAEALIPRRETEILAGCVIDLLQAAEAAGERPLVIDVCTGAGNLPVAYAAHTRQARIFAADLCPNATGLARRNVETMAFHERIEIRTGDLLAPFDDPEFRAAVDVLSCNPPYISSTKVAAMETEISVHEPSLAFDGGAFGISILQKLIQEAPRYLRPGGWLVFEVGLGQGEVMAKRLDRHGDYARVQTHTDDEGAIRAIAAQRH